MQSDTKKPFKSVRNFCIDNPEFSENGLRHLFFYKKLELENNKVVCRFGSRILIDEQKFLQLLAEGFFKCISGRANTNKHKSESKNTVGVNCGI